MTTEATAPAMRQVRIFNAGKLTKYEVEAKEMSFPDFSSMLINMGEPSSTFSKKVIVMNTFTLNDASVIPAEGNITLHVYVENVKSGATVDELRRLAKTYLGESDEAKKIFTGYSKMTKTDLEKKIENYKKKKDKVKTTKNAKKVQVKKVVSPVEKIEEVASVINNAAVKAVVIATLNYIGYDDCDAETVYKNMLEDGVFDSINISDTTTVSVAPAVPELTEEEKEILELEAQHKRMKPKTAKY